MSLQKAGKTKLKKVSMKVGIHYDRYRELNTFSLKYKAILEYNNIEVLLLDSNDSNFFEEVKSLDAFIYRWFHYDFDRQLATTIFPIIENDLGIKCFPNSKTFWTFDDKIKQYYQMKVHNFPMTESWVFWDKNKALEWSKSTQYPVVFKLKGGAGSQNVVLVKKAGTAQKLINKMFGVGFKKIGLFHTGSTLFTDFKIAKNLTKLAWLLKKRIDGRPIETFYTPHKNYALFQKYLPGNEYDTRVTVIGKRAYAFRRFNRKDDFRSSGSGLIDSDFTKIDLNHVKKAFEISGTMGFQSMAYDFLYNEFRESEFCEISYSFVDKALYNCSGYWDEDLQWHEGHFWPQYFQLIDLLDRPDLLQPNL
jgi:glutathione synthase/RimK-type ligase-like ATP-grasp enzyme